MTKLANDLTASIWAAIGGDDDVLRAIEFSGEGASPSTFAVTDLASAAIGAATLSVAELVQLTRGARPSIRVDRRLASFWFGSSIRPIEWKMPAVWDPIAGDYRTNDGWIRLHTNAPRHRAAAERVLGQRANRDEVATAVARWAKADLEQTIVAAGGCAAEMRTTEQWIAHPQGAAIATEPLVHTTITGRGPAREWPVQLARPLAGIRVLDLTRVLAGPVASRFLAGYGAAVLRIDPPDWDEAAVVPEVTLGKRCARLDLTSAHGRATFEALLAAADVLLHGYRPGALDRQGYDAAARSNLRPGLIDVCLCAYGWTGPWRGRRGFDSLVQMSTGIAEAGMRWRNAAKPVPLPMQALDHATGYLMAAAVVRGISRRLDAAQGTQARLSLARTAKLLIDLGDGHQAPAFAAETPSDRSVTIEATSWGAARRLNPPASIDGTPMRWELPATALGSAAPRWL